MNKAHYFYRNIIFSKKGKEISLIDINNPDDQEVLNPWFGMVIQLADGQHTIEQFFKFVKSQYNGNPPESIDDTLDSVLTRLIESKFIMLTEKTVDLPYYLSMPYEELDIEKAKEMIAKDRTNVN